MRAHLLLNHGTAKIKSSVDYECAMDERTEKQSLTMMKRLTIHDRDMDR
jgi:hypothetical protein